MKRKRRLRGVLRGAAWLLGAWLVLTVGAVLALRTWAPPATAVIWLEPGPLADVDYRWVPRSAIAAAAVHAVIAAEDQKFLAHRGFDLVELGQAIDAYRAGERLRGASTISQQVAKNLFLWNGRSFVRKGLELYFTVLIETLWPKERILEVYLNVAELGPGIFGVDAAADRFFGSSASGLTATQAALLAAVLPNPKSLSAANPSEYVRLRQAEIAEQMRLLEQRGHYAGLVW
jgi:monofunctional biosynthetic peptidoglycan transglycosylase